MRREVTIYIGLNRAAAKREREKPDKRLKKAC